MKRSDIIRVAQGYVGTRWQHMGRDRYGVDCVGLLIAVWGDLKLTPYPEIPPYRSQPDGNLLTYFQKYMTRVPFRRIKSGSVVIFAYGGSPYHAGIVVDPERRSMIHANATSRAVVYDIIDHSPNGRKPVCAWDYPGVTDG